MESRAQSGGVGSAASIPVLFISILPFPAKGRDQAPPGQPPDTASLLPRSLTRHVTPKQVSGVGRQPDTHRAPPNPMAMGRRVLPSFCPEGG